MSGYSQVHLGKQHQDHPHNQEIHSNHKKRNYIKTRDLSHQTGGPEPSQLFPAATGVKRALLIGINYTGSDYSLNGCINDIHNVKDLLIQKFGYKLDNMKLLSDDQADHLKPTKQNMLTIFKEFVQLTKPGDELFIHYSGHGTQVPCLNGDADHNTERPGEDDAICPCDFYHFHGDAGFITDDELKETLVNQMPRGSKLRAFFDCCHSGSALDLPYLYKKDDLFQTIEPFDKQSADCLLISGCKDNQTSADAYISGTYDGALTWALLKALNNVNIIKTTWKDLLLLIRH